MDQSSPVGSCMHQQRTKENSTCNTVPYPSHGRHGKASQSLTSSPSTSTESNFIRKQWYTRGTVSTTVLQYSGCILLTADTEQHHSHPPASPGHPRRARPSASSGTPEALFSYCTVSISRQTENSIAATHQLPLDVHVQRLCIVDGRPDDEGPVHGVPQLGDVRMVPERAPLVLDLRTRRDSKD